MEQLMSKAHMIVLGFLNDSPMYGYKIGQIVESKRFSVWSDIKLPSIYKAMQTLEKKGLIAGEQKVEGNNPPRTVYQINEQGRKYLLKLVMGYIRDYHVIVMDFWLALSFAKGLLSCKQMRKVLEIRIQMIKELLEKGHAHRCDELVKEKKIPIIHRHLVRLGNRFLQGELLTLQEMLEEINEPDYECFFKE